MKKSVRIEECTLTATLVGIERGSREVNQFSKLLISSDELFEKFYDIDPIIAVPFGIDMFHPFQTVVKVESINVESNPLLIHIHFYNKSRCWSG